MKDRITRAKALLDLASLVMTDANIGILFVRNGPNGIVAASCASILNMDYRLEGENASKRPAIIQFIGDLDAQSAYRIVDAARDAAEGSVIIVQTSKVENDADNMRAFVSGIGRSVLVTTCHS